MNLPPKNVYYARFRKNDEYVRVGTHVAPAPERIEEFMPVIIGDYTSNLEKFFIDKIAKFHLDFEDLHPFNDGNGRIGRVLICYQLQRLGFPMIIIRDREKKDYYNSFIEYNQSKRTKIMEKIIALALLESMNKRIAYLKGEKIMKLTEFAREKSLSPAAVINAARRQNIPAFREKGVWKIGESFKYEGKK